MILWHVLCIKTPSFKDNLQKNLRTATFWNILQHLLFSQLFGRKNCFFFQKIELLWYFQKRYYLCLYHLCDLLRKKRNLRIKPNGKITILFTKFNKRNQSKPLNLSQFSFMSSWNIAKKGHSLFLLLIHDLDQTFLEVSGLPIREEAPKILYTCAFFMIE